MPVPDHWERLATFLQVSDIHIGDLNPGSGDAAVSAAAARLYGTTKFFDGLLGHHGIALEQLGSLWAKLRDQEGDDCKLLVIGDLTRTGGLSELLLAADYLERFIDLEPPHGYRTASLGVGVVEYIVPGNHDHWSGSFVAFGATPSHYSSIVPIKVPLVHRPVLLRNGRRVQFVGIDSDADVLAFSYNRQLALGKFVSHLRSPLAQPSVPPDSADIRVLLVHHSWAEQHPRILRMRTRSKRELGQFLVRHDFKAILTGHSHDPLLEQFAVQPQGAQVYELRSGSAAQLDEVPASWRPVWGSLPLRKWPPNAVLIHRIYDDLAGGTHWHAQVYRRSEDDGFVELQTKGSSVTFPV